MNAVIPLSVATALALASAPVSAQHAGHAQHEDPPPTQSAQDAHAGHVMDHAGMDHAAMGHEMPADAPPREPVPPVTPEALAAAFPEIHGGHAVHGTSIHSFALVDRLEIVDADGDDPLAWEASGWVGSDLDRLWWRTEGEAVDGDVEHASAEVFYGRAIARWWDGVVGVRHDSGEAPSQTFAAIGVIGLAPQKFEVEATAYIGQGGQAGLGVEAEYDTLLTNRLILQWVAGAEAWRKDDPRRGIGSGLSSAEAGLRLRYEISRRFAPYIGVAHQRVFGDSADQRRAEGRDIHDTRLVAGVRFWF
jgi:copper resistance protein B